MNTVPPARRMVLRLSSDFFPMVLGEGVRHYGVTRDPLPADARVVGARMTDDGREVVLVLESPSFPVTIGDGPLPEIRPMFARIFP